MKVSDVMTMTTAEFVGWVAYMKYENQEQRRAMEKAKRSR